MQKTSVDDKKKPAKGKDSKQPLTSRQVRCVCVCVCVCLRVCVFVYVYV